MKKIFGVMLLICMLASQSYAAVETVSCSSDEVFSQNSCDQCFTGGAVKQGEYKGELSDDWENNSDVAQLLYKEEQKMPAMIALNGATWSEITASDSLPFWEYTADLDTLYDEENLGYKLDAGETVTWLESTIGSSYELTNNPAMTGENIGLLAYDIAVHDLDASGTIDTETKTHRECVVYTSAEGEVDNPAPAPEEPTELPQTGPEHILLAIVALILGFGFLKFRRK